MSTYCCGSSTLDEIGCDDLEAILRGAGDIVKDSGTCSSLCFHVHTLIILRCFLAALNSAQAALS